MVIQSPRSFDYSNRLLTPFCIIVFADQRQPVDLGQLESMTLMGSDNIIGILSHLKLPGLIHLFLRLVTGIYVSAGYGRLNSSLP